MRISLIICFAFITLAFGCKKDTGASKPSLKLESKSGDIVPINSSFQFNFEFEDKEGDLDSLFIFKVRLNQRVVPTLPTDTLRKKVPEFDGTSKGILSYPLSYNSIITAITPPPIPGTTPQQYESDTLTFKFVLKDKATNTSDTLIITPIVVLREL